MVEKANRKCSSPGAKLRETKLHGRNAKIKVFSFYKVPGEGHVLYLQG